MTALFDDLSIRRKVMTSFSLVMLITILLGLFSLSQLAQVDGQAAEIRNDWLPATEVLGRIKFDSMRYRQIEETHILQTAPDKKQAEGATMATPAEKASQEFGEYRRLAAADALLVASQHYLRDRLEMVPGRPSPPPGHPHKYTFVGWPGGGEGRPGTENALSRIFQTVSEPQRRAGRAHGTAQVSQNIAGVNQVVDDTGTASAQLLAATELSQQAGLLRREVGSFLASIRAA